MSGHIAPKRRPAITRITLYAILISGIFIWTWGALNADIENIFGCGESNDNYRQNLAVTCLFALMPPFWIEAPFMTGFYQHGWALSNHPECQK
jgi:hypothetical protein